MTNTQKMLLSMLVSTGGTPLLKMYHLMVPPAWLQKNKALLTTYSSSSSVNNQRCLNKMDTPPLPLLKSDFSENVSNQSDHKASSASFLTFWTSGSPPVVVCPPGVRTWRERIYLAHYPCMLLEWHHHLRQLPSSAGSVCSEILICISSQGQSERKLVWACF